MPNLINYRQKYDGTLEISNICDYFLYCKCYQFEISFYHKKYDFHSRHFV